MKIVNGLPDRVEESARHLQGFIDNAGPNVAKEYSIGRIIWFLVIAVMFLLNERREVK
jgi:hypothetical protein